MQILQHFPLHIGQWTRFLGIWTDRRRRMRRCSVGQLFSDGLFSGGILSSGLPDGALLVSGYESHGRGICLCDQSGNEHACTVEGEAEVEVTVLFRDGEACQVDSDLLFDYRAGRELSCLGVDLAGPFGGAVVFCFGFFAFTFALSVLGVSAISVA